ncbi:MAG: MarR family transcriptional regulator [Rhodobiaceae bacterium]|nr:MarR family transcriptional regulator [Rhodobiaceae bacterium]
MTSSKTANAKLTAGQPSKPLRTKAVSIGADCACLSVRKATRAVTQLYDKHLSRVDIRITQFTLLNAIAAFETISIHDLATELVIDRTTLTRNLKPLIKAGWVQSEVNDKDARVRDLTLTTDGVERLEKAIPYWEKAQAEFVGKIGMPLWMDFAANLAAVDKTLYPGKRPSDTKFRRAARGGGKSF